MVWQIVYYIGKIFFILKKNNILKYDWGGAGISKEVEAITDFKMKFGGEVTYVYYKKIGITIKGKIFVAFSRFLGR